MWDVSDEDATRMLATFRPSQHVKMAWRVADISATSRACRAYGIWRTTDKRAALPDTRDILATCHEDVACRACPQGCYEDAMRKLLPWNLGFTTVRQSDKVYSFKPRCISHWSDFSHDSSYSSIY